MTGVLVKEPREDKPKSEMHLRWDAKDGQQHQGDKEDFLSSL